ncbi:hypothetical protein J5N97_023286 [Dioscorea zingiberensis]|uniref:Extradiol ring-cleavage dioxygenase class III enzyme subunit B domain-containing protein n=1 Tax=Dioscorea zingiberensis TaxID=325984 RepID=A0A9D5CCH5_9LILI|nr:hypothetical protein J5N97_023286 [Dioscorea zingiberensis]
MTSTTSLKLCMSKLEYPAPGAPELAKRVRELLLNNAGFNTKADQRSGLSGSCQRWTAGTITMSERPWHPLRDGVLIIGSGSATHNFVLPSAIEFDTWLKEALIDQRHGDVKKYEAKMAHQWPEHLYPLHVALGAAGGKG